MSESRRHRCSSTAGTGRAPEEHGVGNGEHGVGNGEHGVGNGEHGVGNGEHGAGRLASREWNTIRICGWKTSPATKHWTGCAPATPKPSPS
ncbi:MAG: hypothetical protein GEU97_17970 [Actinophytocola sp.]|nr:hypothetical protein [Actinophytocola sp.]